MPAQYERSGSQSALNVGGKTSIVIFVFMLLGFVLESELAQYVQSNLDYRHPYFLFYIAHSSMFIIFPLHLAFLKYWTMIPAKDYITGLSSAIHFRFSNPSDVDDPPIGSSRALSRFLLLVSLCTIGITFPGVLWFAAITLASVSDVTALWNSNAFWSYVLFVKLHKRQWEPKRLASVIVATIGVLAVVYGSGTPSSKHQESSGVSTNLKRHSPKGPTAPFLGNFLTLMASLCYALYQVLYKDYATLRTAAVSEGTDEEQRRLTLASEPGTAANDDESVMTTGSMAVKASSQSPPFGLYANLITSSIGAITLFVLWIPLPILHVLEIEPFALPSDAWVLLCVIGMALSGVTFYMCFMILLGLWGPIVTSVGNLLTIVLILAFDVVFRDAFDTLTSWSFLGSGMIVLAFMMLAYQTLMEAPTE